MSRNHPATESMYCRRCGYQLVGLSVNRCPECGRPFDPTDSRTFLAGPRQWLWRRWLRRIVLALCMLILLVLVDLVLLYVPWQREQRVAAWVRQGGGLVGFQAGRSAWWAKILVGPDELYQRLDVVSLHHCRLTEGDVVYLAGNLSGLQHLHLTQATITPEALDALHRIPTLRSLWLHEMGITDGDLSRLKGLTGLEHLSLDCLQPHRRITDAGMTHLANLANLRRLDLQASGITDAGLAHFRSLAQLEVLSLLTCRGVTGSGLVHLRGLANLKVLDLRGTSVDDGGLANLASMSQLETLCLGERITAAGLGHVAALANLRQLYLASASMDDEGLAHLRKLPNLREVFLVDPEMRKETTRRLQEALPGVQISTMPHQRGDSDPR